MTLSLTFGDDTVAKTVIPLGTDCHYLGKILTGPLGQMIEFSDTYDTVESRLQLKSIQTVHVDFLNPDGSVYQLSQPWILKFHIDCSTDKMAVATSVVPVIESRPVWSWNEWFFEHFVEVFAFVVLFLGLWFLVGR